MTTDLKTASVLAFERKLDTSAALFCAGNWDNRKNVQGWKPIDIRLKSVRGTISNRLKTKDSDPAKLDASIQNANLQTVDVAMLPQECDTLKVSFTLRVLGGTGKPSACNNQIYQQKLQQIVQAYVAQEGFKTVAQRYAHNIANGRFLWRNRVGAESVEVLVEQLQAGKPIQGWTFNALELSLRNFNVQPSAQAALAQIAEVIAKGFLGSSHVLLQVTAFVRSGAGQEVFPSQELVLEKSKKSKTLYHVDDVAAMHSQKIGNALRTIDTWYPGNEELGPIAVEPYGSVTTLGKAYRQPKEKMDFYSLFDKWVLKDQVPDLVQQHYVIANLIRGGVFGESEKE